MNKQRSIQDAFYFIMKITLTEVLLMVILTSLVYAAPTRGQGILDRKVSLNAQNKEIKSILSEIEVQASVVFTYRPKVINAKKKISFTVTDETLSAVLKQLFSPEISFLAVDAEEEIILRPTADSGSIDSRSFSYRTLQVSVSGTVTDENNRGLPGVNVVLKGTTVGTTTDASGRFSLDVPDGNSTLVFAFIGYATQEVIVGDRTVIDISLVPDVTSLDEVVVIGYGSVEKRDLTGAVSQIAPDEIQAVPVYNVQHALKSRAAGVRVTQNSGEPGGRIEVMIRGGNSMIGSNEPLYVVDGFPITGGISFLNPSDISSIDILKDASATAIYGSRGANGVVIITTKRGEGADRGSVEVSSYYGVQQVAKRYDMLDAKQYAEVANEWLENGGLQPFFDVNQVQNPGTDWQDLIFRVAPIHDHTITFSGASASTNYSVSGNFYGQEGIVVGSDVTKGSFRLNLNHELNNWLKLGINANLSRRELNQVPVNNGTLGTTVLSGALAAPPTLDPYNDEGLPTRIQDIYSFGSIDMRNPLIWFDPWKDHHVFNSMIGNINLDIKLFEGLSFKTLFGTEYQNEYTDTFTPKIYDNDLSQASNASNMANSFLNENTLNYTKQFGNVHDLNVVVGYTYQTRRNRNFGVSVANFPGNTTGSYDLGAAETIFRPGDSYSEWTLASYLGRANYILKDKYLFTFSFRADGSSRFGAENKWGYFPSGAFSWRMSDEPFLSGVEAISDLKLRTSYGVTGNTGLSPYQSLDRLSIATYVYGNNSQVVGYVPSGISNPDLKWESTTQFDVGFDLGIVDNRFRFTFDYYKKNTRDLLASVPLPQSVGFSSILRNIGEIENQGLEFAVQADVLTGDFKWDVSGQISGNRSKVIQLADENDLFGAGVGIPLNSTINIGRVGEPFGVFYGLVEDGLDENGFIKYKDFNGDGVATASDDRVIIGNPYPDFIYGFNTNFEYKNFSLTAFFEGVSGNDIFWATAGAHLNSFQRGTNQLADLYGNYWTEENPDPNAKYPKVSSASAINVSDRYIEDGSYLRLRVLRLAYNIPTTKLGLQGFSRAQVYLTANNLFTITNYPGLDPEVNTRGNDAGDVGTRLLVGIDQSAYPNAKIYAVGLKLSF